MGKAMDFRFGRYMHRVHLNKIPLEILEKRERGRIHYPGTAKIFGYPLLIQERVKLRTSNFVSTFTGSIKKSGKVAVGVARDCRKIFRAPIYTAHRAVIFAVAQLS